MNFVRARFVGRLGSVSLLSAVPALGQESQEPEIVLAVEVTSASPEVVKRLLSAFESALEGEDAPEIADALAAMSAHDNEDFSEPALASLDYRASRLDKQAARELARELGRSPRRRSRSWSARAGRHRGTLLLQARGAL